MSSEQYRGKATLATDIYGLGATLIFLLTKKCPAELPQNHLNINFRSYVKIDNYFSNWLEKSIVANFNQRFQNASVALSALQKKEYFELPKIINKPQGSLIKIINQQNKLLIITPPIWNRNLVSLFLSTLPLVWYFIFSCILIIIFFNLDEGLFANILFLQEMRFLIFAFFLILITFYFIRLYPYHGVFEKKILISQSNCQKKNII